jgi:hypothetical protein
MDTHSETWRGRAIVLPVALLFGVAFWALLAWAVASWLD